MAIALIEEIEELTEEFTTTLLLVNVHRFKRWTVIFGESVSGGGPLPMFKDMVPFSTVVREKVAEARERVHKMGGEY